MATNPFTLGTAYLNPEPVQGDSLTQYLRSLTNWLGTTAPGVMRAGQSMLSAVPGMVQSGINTVGTGLGNIQPAADYWRGILAGGPQATQAIAPYASQVRDLFSTTQNQMSSFLPKGGYRSTQLAELPFQQASQIAGLYGQLQPMAAQQLPQIGSLQGQLGLGAGQLGLGYGQLGLGETGAGTNLLQLALNSLLQRRGQNVQQDTANLGALSGGLSSALSSAAYGYGANQQYSDERLKEGIVPIGRVKGLPLYAFRFKDSEDVRLGVIAQEVRKILPTAVREDGTGYLLVDYDKVFTFLGVN